MHTSTCHVTPIVMSKVSNPDYIIYVLKLFGFNKGPQAKEFTTWFLHFAEHILDQDTAIIIKYMAHS